MKRYGMLWDAICDIDNINDAATKALKKKRGKLTRAKRNFLKDRECLTKEIHQSLVNETYRFSPLYSFKVYEPKERIIHCPVFYPDRILHHCLMNVVKPFFNEKFTADTYACVEGRGVTLALNKVRRQIKSNPQAYYLYIDIRKYYPSIDHEVIMSVLSRVIKCKKTLAMFRAIVNIHDKGIPIGSYVSQYIANLVLTPLDHYMKEVAGAKHYFRYMDDIVLLYNTKEECHKAHQQVIEFLSVYKLTLKKTTKVSPVSAGIDFIGYRIFPTHTLLRKNIKRNMQKRADYLIANNVSDEEFKRQFASYFGWAKHADTRNLLRKTLKHKFYLFEQDMELKKLSDLKAAKWFGLKKEDRVSIQQLVGREIAFFEYMLQTIRGEEKAVVKFAYPDAPDRFQYFITRSDVIKDRLEKDKEFMPFVATVKKVKNYMAYE